MKDGAKYFGLYRGTVLNNIDPLQTGRIIATVPDVGGLTPSTWAMPAVPLTGKQMGAFMVPHPDYPVWTGGFWGNSGEVPSLALAGVPGDPNIVFQTALQNSIVISDLPGPTGGIMLKSTTGATIIVNDTGIYIQNGQGASIVLTGPTVTINEGGLVVV
jgi:hypothetical protein